MACRIESCVSKGGMSLPVVTCHNRPSRRLIALASAVSKLRFRLRLRLHGCPQYAISDGRFAPRLPLQEVKSRSHRSLEHNLRNGARRMPASKVKHCKLRGRGASRGSWCNKSGCCCYDTKHDSQSHHCTSYRHGSRGSTLYWYRWDWFAMC